MGAVQVLFYKSSRACSILCLLDGVFFCKINTIGLTNLQYSPEVPPIAQLLHHIGVVCILKKALQPDHMLAGLELA